MTAPEMLDLRATALDYARRGLEVFPLQVRGKAPLQGTRGLLDATTDIETVKFWWRPTNPAWNIGLRVPVGFVVLDVDPRNGGDLDALGALPPTRIARTGSGGHHVWFRWSGPARGKLADTDGIDLKTRSGYLVVPPSVHPCGGRYEWVSTYPIAALPRHLHERVRPAQASIRGSVQPTRSLSGDRWQGLIDHVATAQEGERNGRLFWAACRLAEEHAPETVVHALARAAASAGLSEREIDRTIASARQKATA